MAVSQTALYGLTPSAGKSKRCFSSAVTVSHRNAAGHLTLQAQISYDVKSNIDIVVGQAYT